MGFSALNLFFIWFISTTKNDAVLFCENNCVKTDFTVNSNWTNPEILKPHSSDDQIELR